MSSDSGVAARNGPPKLSVTESPQSPDDSIFSGERTEGALLMLAVAMLWGSNFPGDGTSELTDPAMDCLRASCVKTY